MKKEDVYALCANDAEKARVDAVYMVAERFNKVPVFETLNTVDAVKKKLAELIKNYEKRLAANQRSQERRKKKKETMDGLSDLLSKAGKVKIDDEEVLLTVKKLIKDKYNEEILKQINELQLKMIKLNILYSIQRENLIGSPFFVPPGESIYF